MDFLRQIHPNLDSKLLKCHMRYIKKTSKDPRRDIDYFKNHLRFLRELRGFIKVPGTIP